MVEFLPSPLGERSGTCDLARAAEEVAGSAIRLLGVHRTRVYRLGSDDDAMTCIASAGPGSSTARTPGSVDTDVMWSRRVFDQGAVLGTPDVLAEPG